MNYLTIAMSAMNLAADNAAQCCATQSRTGIAANQVTCYTTQYCAPVAVLRWVWFIPAHALKEAAIAIKVTVLVKA
jgi:hypothetical protein